jgi:hypothetical protein
MRIGRQSCLKIDLFPAGGCGSGGEPEGRVDSGGGGQAADFGRCAGSGRRGGGGAEGAGTKQTGKLSFTWPRAVCEKGNPQFALGSGLSY